MTDIKLLDCTLRDGGYTNDWRFGESNIVSVIDGLLLAGVDFVECGYLTAKYHAGAECARYNSMDAFRRILPESAWMHSERLAIMINFGEIPITMVPKAEDDSPVIRLAFHKRDIQDALDYMKGLVDLGYRVFVQPMSAQVYSPGEFVNLVEEASKEAITGFYVVDSFGVLEGEEFFRYLSIADALLPRPVLLGYHGHNNLQQAAANAKYMAEAPLAHDKIIDASVFGIGRGAGNLNSELFAKYLNERHGKSLDVECFLDIFDRVLKPIYLRSPWGYSLPYYLSAMHRCHPNYASFFASKGDLDVGEMHLLLASVPECDRTAYTEEKAERIYGAYKTQE